MPRKSSTSSSAHTLIWLGLVPQAMLREAGLIELWKGFEGRRPQTVVRLTADGRRRFVAYLEELERVVRDALPKAESAPARPRQMPPGWQTA